MSALAPGFTRGDRAPDFMLPNPDGKFGRFYDRFKGNLVVLFFYPSGRDAAALGELLGFVERGAALADAGARIVAVTRDAVDANRRLVDAHGIDFTLFSDPEGAITRGYGVAGLATLVLDRNQHVLAALPDAPGDGHAAGALAHLLTEPPAVGAPGIVSAQAPVLLIPNVFDAALCERLIGDWRDDHAEGGVRKRGSGTVDPASRAVDHGIKKRLDHNPSDAVNRELIGYVERRIAPEVFKAFNFATTVIEAFCVGAYEAARGDYFHAHRDNMTPQTANRRFAITVNLNEGYEGGGLMFPEYGDQIYSTGTGGAIVFSCSLLHQAPPVTRGRRFVALSFLIDQAGRRRG